MDKKTLLNYLIEYHTIQYSLDSQDLKNLINQTIFALFEDLSFKQMNDKEWQSYIKTNCYVYCWTQDKIEKLEKINQKQPVILCCSLKEDVFHKDYCCLTNPDKKYKYQYKLFIKENQYGLFLNSFGDCSKHSQEQECLVKFSSFDLSKTERIK